MEQVPQKNLYGLVGSGKAASHFAHYLRLLSIPFKPWSRRLEREQGQAAHEALADADVILLLITDAHIEGFYAAHPFLRHKRVVHFSGSLSLQNIPGAHPLMTFGPELHSLSFYQRIPFVIERGRGPLTRLLPGLPNTAFEMDPALKPLYHALCVLGGNFTTLLWSKFFEGLAGLGLPPEAGLPYLEAVFHNIAANPAAALTGPLARGDDATIARNLLALGQDPYRAVYESFVRAYQETHS